MRSFPLGLPEGLTKGLGADWSLTVYWKQGIRQEPATATRLAAILCRKLNALTAWKALAGCSCRLMSRKFHIADVGSHRQIVSNSDCSSVWNFVICMTKSIRQHGTVLQKFRLTKISRRHICWRVTLCVISDTIPGLGMCDPNSKSFPLHWMTDYQFYLNKELYAVRCSLANTVSAQNTIGHASARLTSKPQSLFPTTTMVWQGQGYYSSSSSRMLPTFVPVISSLYQFLLARV